MSVHESKSICPVNTDGESVGPSYMYVCIAYEHRDTDTKLQRYTAAAAAAAVQSA